MILTKLLFRQKLTVSLLCLTAVSAVNANIVGLWEFEDANNLTTATIGNNLTSNNLNGTEVAIGGTLSASDSGAAQIGVGDYYTVTHGIAPGAGQTYVNQYSLLFDISYPQISTGTWRSLFSTNPDVTLNDGEYFIHPNDESWGRAGISYTDNPTTGQFNSVADTWYRAVLTFDLSQSIDLYIDGILTGIHSPSVIDGNYSLDPVLNIFADNNGEDGLINVSNFAIWDTALNANNVADLGVAGNNIASVSNSVPSPTPLWLFGIGLLAMRSRYLAAAVQKKP